MGKKVVVTGILLLIAAFMASGCWDATDINQKDITTVASVDKKNGEYIFYTEIPNIVSGQSAENGGQGKKSKAQKFSVLKSSGKTYTEARDDLERKLDKPLFLGTARVLILTVDMAKDGIEEFLYRVREDINHRKTSRVITTDEDLGKLLDIKPENEVSAGYGIEDTLKQLTDQGYAVAIYTSEVLDYLSGHHICFVLPNAGIRDGEIALTGYSVIHNAKYTGFILFESSGGLVYFLNNHAKWIYVVPYGKNQATVEVRLNEKKLKPDYDGGKVKFDVDFSFDAIVQYLDTKEHFDETANREAQNNLQKMLLDDIYNTIYQAQSVNRCDYLDFDEAFRIAYPQEFKKMEWQKVFLNIQFKISVKAKLDPGGSMDYDPKITK